MANLNSYINNDYLDFYRSDCSIYFYTDSCFRKKVKDFIKQKRLKLIIDLSDQKYVEYVNILNIVHKLYLICCKKVTDISMLNHVYSLNINCCHKIVNISMLTQIKKLSIYKCDKIIDVGTLKFMVKLCVDNKKIYGLHLLKNLIVLHIYRCTSKYNKFENQICKLKKIRKMRVILNNIYTMYHDYFDDHIVLL